jgi:hypothetical protein
LHLWEKKAMNINEQQHRQTPDNNIRVRCAYAMYRTAKAEGNWKAASEIRKQLMQVYGFDARAYDRVNRSRK